MPKTSPEESKWRRPFILKAFARAEICLSRIAVIMAIAGVLISAIGFWIIKASHHGGTGLEDAIFSRKTYNLGLPIAILGVSLLSMGLCWLFVKKMRK